MKNRDVLVLFSGLLELHLWEPYIFKRF